MTRTSTSSFILPAGLLFLFLAAVAAGQPTVAELRALPSLVKPHHCWPCNKETLLARDPLLVEYTRIIGSLGIRGEYYGRNTTQRGHDELQAAIGICAEVGATITLNYSPFHRVAINADKDPRVPVAAEPGLYRDSLELITRHLRCRNELYATSVRIGAVLLDTEMFSVKPAGEAEAAEWNLALLAKLLPFHTITKELVGDDVPVYWYDYRAHTNTRFDHHPAYLSCDVAGSISLYQPKDLPRTLRDFKTQSRSFAPEPVGVWITLGGGYDCIDQANPDGTCAWVRDLEYPASHSRTIGLLLNHTPRVDHIVLHPGPFVPDREHPWPRWHEHFIAYVKGATTK